MYYKNNVPYVAPVEIKYVDQCCSADSFQYVPLCETLANVLKNEHVKRQLMASQHRERNLYIVQFNVFKYYRII
jgi:hypothetical protein